MLALCQGLCCSKRLSDENMNVRVYGHVMKAMSELTPTLQRSTPWCGHDGSFDGKLDWFDTLLPNLYNHTSYVPLADVFKTARWCTPE